MASSSNAQYMCSGAPGPSGTNQSTDSYTALSSNQLYPRASLGGGDQSSSMPGPSGSRPPTLARTNTFPGQPQPGNAASASATAANAAANNVHMPQQQHQYYPQFNHHHQPLQQTTSNSSSFDPAARAAAMTSSSSSGPSASMSQQQQQQQQQQRAMGYQQFMGGPFNPFPLSSKIEEPTPNYWQANSFSQNIGDPNAPFEFDASMSQHYYQQQQMFAPTEVFPHIPAPTPPIAAAAAASSSSGPGPSSQPVASTSTGRSARSGSVSPQPGAGPSTEALSAAGHAVANANNIKTASGKPPRPPNAWILYRSNTLAKMSEGERIPLLEEVLREIYGAPKYTPHPWPTKDSDSENSLEVLKKNRRGKRGGKDINWYMWMLGLLQTPTGGMPQSDVSKVISACWRKESEEQRRWYDQLSQMKKAEHALLYPGYKFQPQKREDKLREKAQKAAEREQKRQEKEDRVHRSTMKQRRRQRRSPSAESDYHHPYAYPQPKRNSMNGADLHDAARAAGYDLAGLMPNRASESDASPSTQGAVPGHIGSPEHSPPPDLPMSYGEGTEAMSWTAPPPVAANQPTLPASFLNTLPTNYEPTSDQDAVYYFQPVAGTLPAEFAAPVVNDDTLLEDPDLVVASWAEAFNNGPLPTIEEAGALAEMTGNWDEHEAQNMQPNMFGEGAFMQKIKSDWNTMNNFSPSSTGVYFSTQDNSNAADNTNMQMSMDPSLAGPLPLSPVNSVGEQQQAPLPVTNLPAWATQSRSATPSANASGGTYNVPRQVSSTSSTYGSTPMPLSVDPTTLYTNDLWSSMIAAVGDDDGTSGTGNNQAGARTVSANAFQGL